MPTGLACLDLDSHPAATLSRTLAAWRKQPGVDFVELDSEVHALGVPNDPGYLGRQYGHQLVGAETGWELWQPQGTAILAVLDSGADLNHPDLRPSLLTDDGGRVIGFNAIQQTQLPQDDHGHGTHVSGIALAAANNGLGIAGLASHHPNQPSDAVGVRLMPVKVLNSRAGGRQSDVANGITWAADHGADVINMSLGGDEFSETVARAVDYAYRKGVVVIAAAGNSGASSPVYPAGYLHVTAVAATDPQDRLADYSNWGAGIDVCAPGSSIFSTGIGGGFLLQSGTSMAAPMVSAAAAMLRSQRLDLDPDTTAQLIVDQTDAVTLRPGRSLPAGVGRMNLAAALQAVGASGTGLSSVTVGTGRVVAGTTTRGRVRLSLPASGSGVLVSMESEEPELISVPPSVFVANGLRTADFDVQTQDAGAGQVVRVTATLFGVTREAPIHLSRPLPRVTSLEASPPILVGGDPFRLEIHLDRLAPPGGMTLFLTGLGDRVTLPETATIAEGTDSASVTVTTRAVRDPTPIDVTAASSEGGMTSRVTLVPRLQSVEVTPSVIVGPQRVKSLVRLASPAGLRGDLVSFITSDRKVLTTPSRVKIRPGERTGEFIANVKRVKTRTDVVLTALLDGARVEARLQISPVP